MSDDRPPSHFHFLPDELLVEILRHCPLEDILRAETTCKRLRHACRSREVWLAIIQDLPIDCTPVLPPNVFLDDMPVKELRNRVLSSMSWGPKAGLPSREAVPTLTGVQTKVFDVPMDKTHANRDLIVKPRLLPGGFKAFVVHRGRLELLSISSGECLWQCPSVPERPSLRCFAFDFEYTRDEEGRLGNLLNLATIDGECGVRTNSHLRIFQYDIAKRQGTLLTEATTTPGFLSSLCIRQNYIILPYAQVSTAVLDWKSGKYLCLDFVDAEDERYDPLAAYLAKGQMIAVISFPKVEEITGGGTQDVSTEEAGDRSSDATDSSQSQSGDSTESDDDYDPGVSPCSAVKVDLARLPAHKWKDNMDEALSDKVELRVAPSDRGSPSIVELPFLDRTFQSKTDGDGSSGDGDQLRGELEGPYIFATHSFESNWLRGSPTEIILAACLSEWDADSDEKDRFHLLSYHLRVSREDPSSPATLSLVNATVSPAPTIAWNPSAMTNNGRILSFLESGLHDDTDNGDPLDPKTGKNGSSLMQYSLFCDEKQPLRRLMLDREVLSPKTPVLTAADPWTGAIALRTPGRLRVVHLERLRSNVDSSM